MLESTRKTMNIFYVITLGLLVAFLTQCGGVHDAIDEVIDEASDDAASALLAETAVVTATTTVEASVTEVNESVSELIKLSENETLAEEDYLFVLSTESHDCLISGTYSVDATSNYISFDDCVNTIAGSTLTADGYLTLEIQDNGMTADSSLMLEMEWVNGEYGQITQSGQFMSEIADNISTIDFEDFEGEVTCAGETIAYYVDGYIDYDLDTELVDGEITVNYDGIETDCEFDDFDIENATAAEWLNACGN